MPSATTRDRRRYRFYFVLFIFLLAGSAALAQGNPKLDSLWKIVATLRGNDTTTLKKKKQQLSDMFGVALSGDIPSALRVTDSLAETCRLLGDSGAYYEALYRHKASIYQSVYDHRKVFAYLQKYADAVMRLGLNNGYAYVDIGNQYFSMSLMDVAKQYYQKASEVFIRNNNYAGNCTVLDNMATIWREKKNLDSCLYFYNRSLAMRRDKLHDPYLVAYTYLKMGNALQAFGKEEEAIRYAYRCRSLMDNPAFEQYRDFVTLREYRINCYRMLALYHIRHNRADSGSFYVAKADEQAQRYNVEKQFPLVDLCKAKLATLQKNYPEALNELRKSEQLLLERQDGWELIDVYTAYIDYYEQQKDFESATRIYKKRTHLNDSLSLLDNDDQMLIVNNALLQYENEATIEKQGSEILRKDVATQKTERDKRNLLYTVLGLLALVLLIIFFLFQFRKKNRLIGQYNRDLEAANRTKEKFLSVISHDLRTPFNTLIGLSGTLSANLKAMQFDQAAANAALMNEASRKAYVMLDNLMQWVSLQKENIHAQKKRFSLHELLDEVLLIFKSQAMAQSLTVNKNINVSYAFTDRNMLQVILRNLLSNAMRYTPAGGTVSILVDNRSGDLLIEVQDNGRGLSSEELVALNQPKERMDVAKKGGGLGLELVREFLNELGGSLQVANVEKGGAKFTILLKGAASSDPITSGQPGETNAPLVLSEAEKKQLAPLLAELETFEIFDTTEIRQLLDKTDTTGHAALSEWKNRMLQAVYHTDNESFHQLLQIARA